MVNGVVGNASWNAWIPGVIVFVVAVSAIGRMKLRQVNRWLRYRVRLER
jgi:hypothetical protein